MDEISLCEIFQLWFPVCHQKILDFEAFFILNFQIRIQPMSCSLDDPLMHSKL
jgi:hypothetical protein